MIYGEILQHGSWIGYSYTSVEMFEESARRGGFLTVRVNSGQPYELTSRPPYRQEVSK